MLNSVEASTQPCLTPFVTGNGLKKLAIILDPCRHTIVELPHHCYEFGGIAKLCHNFPKSLTTDCVKFFRKVDKGHVEVHILFLVHILSATWSCCAVKIMSIVPLSLLNPHWLSGRSPDCSRCSFNRFSRTLARILAAIDNKEMSRWLSQTWGFPFLFLDNCCIFELLRNGFFSPYNMK